MKRKKKGDATGELRNYRVSIPIAGSVTVYVEATSEDEATEKAWEKIGDDDAEVEWEAHEHIATGNALHASMNDIEVDLED
jgi:hypothetical protein